MRNARNRFVVNIGLLLFGLASAFSGMLIQINYHIGNHGSNQIPDFVLGMNYHSWSVMHKISIVILSLLMIYHIYQHWKWYKVIVTKKLFAKNQQVLMFSILFILVAVTGLTPWIIDLLNGNEIQRKVFVEIHDKIAIILSIYLVLHIVKRLKWYVMTFDKIKR